MVIFELPDEDLGVTTFVSERADGRFAVGVRDDDADAAVPFLKVFVERERAIEYARRVASGQP